MSTPHTKVDLLPFILDYYFFIFSWIQFILFFAEFASIYSVLFFFVKFTINRIFLIILYFIVCSSYLFFLDLTMDFLQAIVIFLGKHLFVQLEDFCWCYHEYLSLRDKVHDFHIVWGDGGVNFIVCIPFVNLDVTFVIRFKFQQS